MDRPSASPSIAAPGSRGLLSITQAATFLGVSVPTLRYWEKEGKITALRTTGGVRRYRLSELKKVALQNPRLAKRFEQSQTAAQTWTQPEPEMELELIEVPEPLNPETALNFPKMMADEVQPERANVLLRPTFTPEITSKFAQMQLAARSLKIGLTVTSLATLLFIGTAVFSAVQPEQSAQGSVFGKLAATIESLFSPSSNNQLDLSQVIATKGITPKQNDPLAGSVLGQVVASGTAFLEINSDVAISGHLSAPNLINSLTAGNANILVTPGPNPTISLASTVNGVNLTGTTISAVGGYTQSGTSPNLFTGTTTFSNATYAALFTGGNVGIGTTTPSTTLYVEGAGTFTKDLTVKGKATLSGDVETGGTLTAQNLKANGTTTLGSTSISSANISSLTASAVTFNGVSYTFPSAQGSSGYVLANDGSGTLNWVSSSGIIAADSLDFTEMVDAMTLDASTDIAMGGFNLSTSGSGNINFASSGTFTVAGTSNLATIASGTWNGSAIGIAYGGTGITTAPTNGQLLIGNTATGGYSLATLATGTGIGISNGNGTITISNTNTINGMTGDIVIAGAGINAVSAVGGTVTVTGTEADTLNSVAVRGSTTSNGITLVENGNLNASYALTLKRAVDTSPLGYLIHSTSNDDLTSLFDVDVNGLITTPSVNATSIVNGSITGSDLASNISISSTGTAAFNSMTLTTALPVSSGGTGQSAYTNGQLLIGNTATGLLDKATLTAGTAIGISNGNGSITINNTGVASLIGTANQIDVSAATGTITLSLPQNIATSSSASFASIALTDTTNQIRLGTTNTVTLTSTAPASSRVYTIPDFGSDDTFVGVAATQTLTNKTLTSPTINSATIASSTISGGTINNTPIGGTTRAAGAFTTLAANSTVTITGLTGGAGAGLCLDGSNTIVTCSTGSSSGTLQSDYNNGNSITTTDARNILFTLADTTTDSNFKLTNEGTATAFVIDDTNAATNTVFALQSAGVNTLTITEAGTIAGATISGSSNTITNIGNSSLTNNSITINTGTGLSGGASVALGGSVSLTNTGVTSLAGTANQVTVSAATGSVTLSLPQNIATASSPSFAGLSLTSLSSSSGSALCLNGTTVVSCSTGSSTATLQSSYDNGNTITTTTARNIAFTLADTATDASFSLTNAGTATAMILNDTNAGSNTTLDIQSGGVSKLTITELGTLSTSGNIATTGSGTITSAGAFSGPTSSNTINNLVINSGALSSVTGITFSSGNFDQSGSAGTFKTGTGAVTLNGDTTVATGKNLTVTNGTTSITGTTGITGTTSINTSGSSTTTIGNSSGGGVSLLSSAASSFVVTGATLTLQTASSGTLSLSSAGALNFTGAAASTWNLGANSLTLTASNATLSTAGVLSLAGAQTTDITTLTAGNGLTIQPLVQTTNGGTGGGLTLKGGNETNATAGNGGAVAISGGTSTASTGGSVSINGGAGVANGSITVGTANTAALSLGNASATFALASTGLNVSTAGQLTVPNGSASTPSYSFTNQANTGMYWDGTSLNFAVSGSRYMYVSTGSSGVGNPFLAQAANANALAVGPNGTTNPTFQVDTSASSVATGLKVTGAAAASGVALAAISSGTNENLTIDAKGSGTITLGATSTGNITLTRNTNVSGNLYVGTQASATPKVGIWSATTSEKRDSQLSLYDTTAQAAGVGGFLGLGGKYTNVGDYTTWAGIGSGKNNATDANYGGYLSFYTRTHGSDVAERWRIDTTGNFITASDNAYDIGASGANRPRAIYTAGLINVGSSATIANGLTVTAGNVGVGGAPTSQVALRTNGSITAAGGNAIGVQSINTLVAAANSNDLAAFRATPTFTPGGFTSLGGYDYYAANGTGAVASMYGVYVESLTNGTTNNYGIYVNAPSGGNAVGIYNAGTTTLVGAVTMNSSLAVDSLTVGGGYGSTGVTISNAGAISMDGALLLSASGSNTSPAIRMNADTNTGWYEGVSNTWSFAASGSEVLRMSASGIAGPSAGSLTVVNGLTVTAGNVGIGISSPGRDLSVMGDTAKTGAVEEVGSFSSNDGTDPLELVFNIGNNATAGSRYTSLQSVEQNQAFRSLSLNPSGGNVGIGTTGPGSTLDVRAVGSTALLNLTATTGTNFAYQTISNGTGATEIGTERSTTGGLFTGTLAYASVFGSTSNTATQFATNNNVRMTIDTSGQVGIGTATPGTKLDVNGNIRLGTGAANSVLTFVDGNSSNLYRSITDTGTGLQITNAEAGGTVLSLVGNSGGTDYFTTTNIDVINFNSGQFYLQQSNGNIGIGDITPDANLDIDTAATSGTIFGITSTGVQTSGDIFNITANSATTADIIDISATGLTTGSALNITGPSTAIYTPGSTKGLLSVSSSIAATDLGGDTNLVYLAPDFQSTSGSPNGYGLHIAATDNTTSANANYGVYSEVVMTGNASKTAFGGSFVASTSSNTGGGVYGTYNAAQTSGALSSGSIALYGSYADVAATGASSGGTQNVYGYYSDVSLSNATAGSTSNIFGGFFSPHGGVVAAGGTVNTYGVYVDNGGSTTNGTSSKYGLYVEDQTGADTNIGIYNAGTTTLVGAVTMNSSLAVDSLTVGGGYGSSGVTISNAGAISMDSILLLGAGGSNTTPAIRINGDTNTGWYQATTNSWSFASSATEILRITSSGLSGASGNTLNVSNGLAVTSGGASITGQYSTAASLVGSYVAGNGNTGTTNSLGVYSAPSFTVNGAVNIVSGFYTYPTVTVNAAQTLSELSGLHIANGAITNNGTITNRYGVYIEAPTNGTTNIGLVNVGTTRLAASANIGGNPSTNTVLGTNLSVTASGTAAHGIYNTSTLNAAANSDSLWMERIGGTLAKSTFTGLNAYQLDIENPAVSGAGTIDSMYGMRIAGMTRGGTNNYGLYINAPSGGSSNNIGLYSAGTGNFTLSGSGTNYGLLIQDDRTNTTANHIRSVYVTGSPQTATGRDILGTLISQSPVKTAGVTSNWYGLSIANGTPTGSGSLDTIAALNVDAFSATSTSSYGLKIGAVSGGATNNYGIHVTAPSGGTTAIGIYNGGSSLLSGNIAAGSGGAIDTSRGFSLRPGTANFTGTTQIAQVIHPTFSSAATSEMIGLYIQPESAAASYTTGTVTGLELRNPSKGSGHTITSAYGAIVRAQTAGGTNNYGLYVDQPSGGSGGNYNMWLNYTGQTGRTAGLVIGSTISASSIAGPLWIEQPNTASLPLARLVRTGVVSHSFLLGSGASDPDLVYSNDNSGDFLFNTGNVGIGSTSSNQSGKLHVESTSAGARTTGLFLMNNSSTVNTATSIDFAPNVNIALARLNALRTDTSGGGTTDFVFSNYKGSTATLTDTMIIKGDTGYVGIGTGSTAPTYKLQISEATASQVGLMLHSTVAGAANQESVVRYQGNSTATNQFVAEIAFVKEAAATNLGQIQFRTGNGSGGSNTRMTLNSSGQLQIPTTGTSAGLVLGTTNTVTLQDDPTVAERAGSARRQYQITLTPEFPGAVLTGDGSNNTGTMTSDFCAASSGVNSLPALNTSVCAASGETHHYYAWTANATNDYDIWMQWQVPSDFSAFAASNPIQFYGWRTTSSDSVTLTFYSANGSTCGTGTAISNTTTWTVTNYTSSGCSPTAGDLMKVRVQLSVGVNSEFARMGEIVINYLSKFK